MNVHERVLAVVARAHKLPVQEVRPGRSLEELGIDSLGAVYIQFCLEEEFDILIPNEELSSVRSVDDIVAGVERHIAAKNAPVSERRG